MKKLSNIAFIEDTIVLIEFVYALQQVMVRVELLEPFE